MMTKKKMTHDHDLESQVRQKGQVIRLEPQNLENEADVIGLVEE